ncbi:MAG TPA: serine hydrolase, partial [Opitutus sp.]|nr:serine hydrolase [Opitutus sp.]
VSVFSVGRANAIDQSLFRADVTYDGVADIQAIGVQSGSGRFGGIRAGNAELWGTTGWVGINATRVSFEGPVRIGNLSASDAAEPMLRMETGAGANVDIAGGDLLQENARAIHLDGAITVTAIAGEASSGEARPTQVLRGTFRNDRR